MATFTTEEYFEATDILISSTHDVDVSNDDGQETVTLTFTEALKIVVGIVGMIGNLTVCIAVIQMRSRDVKFLIGSQAAIDMLTSFVLVVGTFTSRWLFTQLVSPESSFLGYLYCMFWHWDGLLYYLFSMSTYNLIAISIERYLTVMHPMWYRANFTRGKAIILGAIMWLIAPTMQLVVCVGQTLYIDGFCVWTNFSPVIQGVVGVLLFIWDFFGPCIIMGYCFAKIIIEIKEQDQRATKLQADYEDGGKDAAAAAAGRSRSRNVTKAFLVVFIAFVLCWVTNQVLYLQQNLGGYDYHGNPENHFANGMAILNSAINPFIYVLRFKQYREKMTALFCIQQKHKSHELSSISNSTQVVSG